MKCFAVRKYTTLTLEDTSTPLSSCDSMFFSVSKCFTCYLIKIP